MKNRIIEHMKNLSKKNIKGANTDLLPLIEGFLIALYCKEFNLDSSRFRGNEEVLSFLSRYDDGQLINDLKIDREYLNVIKRYTWLEFNRVAWSPERQRFCEYVKQTFPDFKSDELFTREDNETDFAEFVESKESKE